MEYRPLGTSGLRVSVIGLGCWPIAGIGWTGVDEQQSLAALHKALDVGVNFIDTAYMYGKDGESERLVGRAIAGRRDEVVLATKCGLHWKGDQLTRDSSRKRIMQQVEESLRRLNTDSIDLYQVHAYDPNVPVEETARALHDLLDQGKVRAIGVSNYEVPQMEAFARSAPLHSNQPPYNLLMREIERDLLPYCRRHTIAVLVYWPLYKGLLTGKYGRGHRFPDGDSRLKDRWFKGKPLKRTLDMLDHLRPIADECGKTLTQVILNWTISQPGVTLAICGATRPEHVVQNAGAAGWRLTDEQMRRIDEISRKAVTSDE
ncbi:MAG: aldo/keto reductase [Candidatus Latescibacteria bacterium]|nr:aldo/keto reductase [Candidatus Latescibacterota bacterium]